MAPRASPSVWTVTHKTHRECQSVAAAAFGDTDPHKHTYIIEMLLRDRLIDKHRGSFCGEGGVEQSADRKMHCAFCCQRHASTSCSVCAYFNRKLCISSRGSLACDISVGVTFLAGDLCVSRCALARQSLHTHSLPHTHKHTSDEAIRRPQAAAAPRPGSDV